MYFQPKLYQSVIDDVVANVRESFLDDGVDEQVLHELKQVRTFIFEKFYEHMFLVLQKNI